MLQAQSVTTDRPSYAAGEDIVVDFTGGPANAKDWIGIYPTGITPGSVGSTLWSYVNGTQTSTTGVADGTITFPGGLSAAGDYDVHVLEDDGYGVLATTKISVIGGAEPVASAAIVRTEHGKYFPGESISVTFENGPGNSKDWIGIYPEGIEPGSEGSTLWFYVNGSQTAAAGKVDGSVTFDAGLNLAGNWVAYLLENDGYSKLALADFQVVAPFDTLVRPDKRTYAPGEAITIEFRNGFGNAKDWIGIYPTGTTPGSVGSTLWAYVSGTQTSTTGEFDGTATFADGLSQIGDYEVHFLINDGYDVVVTETISVAEPAITVPKVVGTQPPNDATDVSPGVDFSATIKNGSSKVTTDSISLSIDGAKVAHVLSEQDDLMTVSYSAPTLMPPNSIHTYELGFTDDATPPNTITAQGSFTVANYKNIILPEPIVFEDFNSTSEGELPTGWTEENFTDILNFDLDLENLDSYSYSTWTVVDASRFTGSFVVYSNPDAPQGQKDDYQRVLTVNPRNVVNGTVLNEPLAEGRFLFGNAGYRNGIGQVLYVFTPDFDLTGESDVHLSFHSLWEQNQDSMGAVEYSTDRGQTWLPIIYMLDEPDIVRDDQDSVDAIATFTQEHEDVARFFDPLTGEEKGGTYGAFIAAAVDQNLGTFVSSRVNDDSAESKRVELFRLAEADNQSTVRFRFAHAGADSWYFGIDNFGLYSISETPSEPAQLAISRAGDILTIEWPASATGFVLESADSVPSSTWTEVTGVANNTASVTVSTETRFFRLRKP